MKPRQFDNNNDIKKEQTKHTKNWKWYFNIYFVKGLVKRPLPIEAYINARTHFRKTGGSFSMMKGANSRTQTRGRLLDTSPPNVEKGLQICIYLAVLINF